MTGIEQKVYDAVGKVIEDLGYSIWDVIYEKEGKDNYLRIFIDKDTGVIDINDCETVNNAITDLLDEKDIIKAQYYLEISSSGLERRLRSEEHFKYALNKKVEVHLYKPIDKKKEFIGVLKEYTDKDLKIEIEKENKNEAEELTFLKEDISSIKTIFNWEDK